jgi:hypothetical protein
LGLRPGARCGGGACRRRRARSAAAAMGGCLARAACPLARQFLT